MIANSDYIEAGQIINTHGVTGELKIEVWLDSPSFMKGFKRFYIDSKEYAVRSSRVFKDFLLVSLDGINDMNTAETLKGRTVYIFRSDAKLPKGAYFLCDIIGARVLDESGREIGILEEIVGSPAQPVYVVKGDTEHLIPAVPEFIMSTDLSKHEITVHLIEGM